MITRRQDALKAELGFDRLTPEQQAEAQRDLDGLLAYQLAVAGDSWEGLKRELWLCLPRWLRRHLGE